MVDDEKALVDLCNVLDEQYSNRDEMVRMLRTQGQVTLSLLLQASPLAKKYFMEVQYFSESNNEKVRTYDSDGPSKFIYIVILNLIILLLMTCARSPFIINHPVFYISVNLYILFNSTSTSKPNLNSSTFSNLVFLA